MLHEQRQASDVIGVGMGHPHHAQGPEREGEAGSVALALGKKLPCTAFSAVQKNPCPCPYPYPCLCLFP